MGHVSGASVQWHTPTKNLGSYPATRSKISRPNTLKIQTPKCVFNSYSFSMLWGSSACNTHMVGGLI